MDPVEQALALKVLEQENSALRKLLAEFQDMSHYKREAELVASVKTKIIAWAKAIAAVVVASAALIGVTTFIAARDAVIKTFAENTAPKIQENFTKVILPRMREELKNDASKKFDEQTSANAEQFETRMNALFEELKRFALENRLIAPPTPTAIDATGRPSSGYVLRSFLRPVQNDIYVVTTFRLNVRDQPNGEILGRQVKGAKVRITETSGDWVKVDVVPDVQKSR